MKELRDLVKQVAPTVLCVLETQVHKARVESLKGTLGYEIPLLLAVQVAVAA